jgi:hypothetical protein
MAASFETTRAKGNRASWPSKYYKSLGMILCLFGLSFLNLQSKDKKPDGIVVIINRVIWLNA